MNKANNARLSQRVAEEAQLLAEEKWIINALKILKQQRNCLQIERLHLENLKATINNESLRNLISSTDNGIDMPNQPSMQVPTVPVQEPSPEVQGTSLAQFDGPVAGIDNDMCNNEELNLSVTNSVFVNHETGVYDVEEDEDDMENCEIDMNMFMYGK